MRGSIFIVLVGCASGYTLVEGLLPAGNDIEPLQGPADIEEAKKKCDKSRGCIGFTFDVTKKDTRPYMFFKSQGTLQILLVIV
jgi:hypothetical protein